MNNRYAVLNDVHSALNRTLPRRVAVPATTDELVDALLQARADHLPVIPFGGRHAMGGQQFCSDGLCLDLTRLDRLLEFDLERGLVRFEAGTMWPAVVAATASSPWAIRQKQTGADDFTLGGSLAANIHGRGLTMAPFVSDVESFVLLSPEGTQVRCSRESNPDLFSLVAGGYGLFGPVTEITLRLTRRKTLRRRVRRLDVDALIPTLEDAIRSGALYGDWQFAVDESRADFLQHGILSCYEPAEPGVVLPDGNPTGATLSREQWQRLLRLACTQRHTAFERYADHYLRTDGQLYASDRSQLSTYLPAYAAEIQSAFGSQTPVTLMISELYIPRPELPGFLRAAAAWVRRQGEMVIYGTVRLIERDTDSVLAWAREPWACVVLNLVARHEPSHLERLAQTFRGLIDLALERSGSYYLTYHRFATRSQLRAAHPNIDRFLAQKQGFDPEGRFQSDWFNHLVLAQ